MIDTASGLRSLVDRARKTGVVALDTEFVWERTYYPQLGLVQVGLSDDDCSLVDAAALDLTPLGEILEDPAIVKILHDAQQDLSLLRRATGSAARNVFDTQLAAGFVGLSATASLQDLVQALFDVTLPKTATRTDWLRRPLSDEQVDYALDDVRYLPEAREILLDRAERLGRAGWMAEELDAGDFAPGDVGAALRQVLGALGVGDGGSATTAVASALGRLGLADGTHRDWVRARHRRKA